jgi:hypothetical protein
MVDFTTKLFWGAIAVGGVSYYFFPNTINKKVYGVYDHLMALSIEYKGGLI